MFEIQSIIETTSAKTNSIKAMKRSLYPGGLMYGTNTGITKLFSF